MTANDTEGDYVLGTNDRELQRLGYQHRVWRPAVLECWKRAGVTVGSRVLDVGSGPGFATLDLAEIVQSSGTVVGVERSPRFIQAAQESCHSRGFSNVRFHALDLMTDPLPEEDFDVAWIRWVASFVTSPETLVAKLARAVRPGGLAVFHEYVDYSTWRLAPRCPRLEEFVQTVMQTWRDEGGEPDIARELPAPLARFGFRIETTIPHVFCARPADPVWRWPAEFIQIHLDRLHDLGRVDGDWVESVRREFHAAETDSNSLMITPMVLEIIARRMPDESGSR